MNDILYKLIFPNNKYNSSHIKENFIKENFPDLYNEIKGDYFKENLYCKLYDIKEIPKCPVCGNKLHLRSFIKGFRKFCSNKCIGLYQRNDLDFSNKISKTRKLKSTLFLSKKYNLNISKDSTDNNYFIINDYCKHSPFKIYGSVFTKLYKENKCLCLQCNEELYKSYIPTQSEIDDFLNKFEKFYNDNCFNFNEKWFLRYYPKEFKIINYYCSHLNTENLSEKIYLFKNKLKYKPICNEPNCNCSCEFNNSQLRYNYYCSKHKTGYNASHKEFEIRSFLSSLNINYETNVRNIISSELDIYIPEKNIAIEFNGLYWHSELFKDKFYHYNKWKECYDNNIQLLTIWEDDWIYKQDIVKSLIKAKLNLIENKIYARKCIIKNVNKKDEIKFLNDNHLQGYCISSFRLGLYYNNELVSLMTFGKSRFKSNSYELLRFCNKLNFKIIGGFSKLLKNFINKNEIKYLESYSSCDISNGDVYLKNGFKLIKHTGINYWWFKKDKKENRFNYQKHKLHVNNVNQYMFDNNYKRIFGTGNLLFYYETTI